MDSNEHIQRVIADAVGQYCPAGVIQALTPATEFADLGINEVMMFEVVAHVEDSLDISIMDSYKAKPIQTVSELAALIATQY